jgi:ubiquinone/menaquinone biosynthesis C-methylase UbiE
MPERELPDYALTAREHWTKANADFTSGTARDRWSREEIAWGVWKNPESEVRILPDLHGLEVIELGCGTAYFGAWLKKHGARRVVGIDITPAQLDTARDMNEEFGLGLEFIEGNAEDVPLPDGSFDLAFSEYGASIWCDPYRWIPEAARLLRSGGELVFMRNTDLEMVCSADEEKVSEKLVRPLRGMRRLDWTSEEASTEFHIPTSEMFGLLRLSGFEVLDYRQLYAREDSVDHSYYSYVPVEWARQWPSEEIWRARKS